VYIIEMRNVYTHAVIINELHAHLAARTNFLDSI